VVLTLAIAGAALVGLLYVVPVPQHVPDSFSISSRGSIFCGWGPNLTALHDGTFEFSWVANDSSSLTFVIMTSSFTAVFTGYGEAGGGRVGVVGGSNYLFNLCSANAVTIQVAGSLNFAAPVL